MPVGKHYTEKELLHILHAGIFPPLFKEEIEFIYKTPKIRCLYHCPPGDVFFKTLYRFKFILQLLEINTEDIDTYIAYIEKKDSISSDDMNEFFEYYDLVEEFITEKLNLFSCEECIRLDEAIHNFEEGCYYSSVIMAVSALESRLHFLFKQMDKKIYSQSFENKTLGQLIQILDPGMYKDPKFSKFKKIMGSKYRPLLELCNTYRIFSAHPKNEKIDRNVANSILNLTFLFLMDRDITKRRTLHKHKI
jgi:hypothetical protein